MKSKIVFLIAGILCMIILIPVSISFKLDREVYLNGRIVKVKIVKLPDIYTSKRELMFFELDGKTYTKSITKGMRDQLNIGDSIKLKYSPEVDGHLLFPDENPIYVGYALICGALFISLGCFYYAFRK